MCIDPVAWIKSFEQVGTLNKYLHSEESPANRLTKDQPNSDLDASGLSALNYRCDWMPDREKGIVVLQVTTPTRPFHRSIHDLNLES